MKIKDYYLIDNDDVDYIEDYEWTDEDYEEAKEDYADEEEGEDEG